MKTPSSLRAAVVAALLAAGASAALAQVRVADGWARPTVAGQSAGGGYLRIENAGAADRLVGASAPAAAASVELHEMKMDGDVMRMRRIDGIEVPAGGQLELKPGGLHLMLMGLKAPLKTGATVPLTLKFEKAGEVKATLEVAARPGAAGQAPMPMHGHK